MLSTLKSLIQRVAGSLELYHISLFTRHKGDDPIVRFLWIARSNSPNHSHHLSPDDRPFDSTVRFDALRALLVPCR